MADETRVGDVLLKREDLTKTVNSKRGIFVLRMADPLVRKGIIRNISASLNHAALDSIPADDYFYVKAVETLRLTIIEKPDWWEGIDRCMDDDLITELYTAYLELEDGFRRLLRGNSPQGGGKKAKPA